MLSRPAGDCSLSLDQICIFLLTQELIQWPLFSGNLVDKRVFADFFALVASGYEVGVGTFGPAVCRVEVDELATVNCYFGCACRTVSVKAVQNKLVRLVSLRISLHNAELAAADLSLTFINIHGVNITDKLAVFYDDLATVLNVNRIAVILFRFLKAGTLDCESSSFD